MQTQTVVPLPDVVYNPTTVNNEEGSINQLGRHSDVVIDILPTPPSDNSNSTDVSIPNAVNDPTTVNNEEGSINQLGRHSDVVIDILPIENNCIRSDNTVVYDWRKNDSNVYDINKPVISVTCGICVFVFILVISITS
jgi:hypothetical protein